MLATKTDMSISKQDQFVHENKTWERLLDFFKQENIFLKNRLSVVVDSEEDKEFLKQAEYFQNEFILKDGFINDLIKDVNDHKKYINANIEDGNLIYKISKKQAKLRNEISNFEKDFSYLKNEFNKLIEHFLV